MKDTTALLLEGDSDSARAAGREGGSRAVELGCDGGGGGGGQIKGREWAGEKKRKAKQNEKQQTQRLSKGGRESTASERK